MVRIVIITEIYRSLKSYENYSSQFYLILRTLIFQFYFPLLLYMVKTVQVPYNTGISWLAENLLASQQ